MAYVGGVGVPLRMLQHTLGAQRVKSLTLASRMEQKFRKLLLQRGKSVMGELEYGPQGRMMLDYLQFSRGPQRPWIRWCNTAACWAWPLRTSLRPGFPQTGCSQETPAEGVWHSEEHLCCAVCFSENHPKDAPISIPSLCSPPHLCRWVKVFL